MFGLNFPITNQLNKLKISGLTGKEGQFIVLSFSEVTQESVILGHMKVFDVNTETELRNRTMLMDFVYTAMGSYYLLDSYDADTCL